MIVRNIFDATQSTIVAKLAVTEHMIRLLCEAHGGDSKSAQIIALEDLGVSNNVTRMRGGFYTGMYASWKTEIPFVPVDATINACGVSVFRVCDKISSNDFISRIDQAKYEFSRNSLKWNFDNGNHFISLCINDNGEQYLIIHASDNKYKFGEFGLYPREDTWFFPYIKKIEFQERYIRYISGTQAEKFYEIYRAAEQENPKRNRYLAELVLGKNFAEIGYFAHYGMPNQNSIAIGCQWKGKNRILLSALGKDIFMYQHNNEEEWLSPHGFGVKLIGDERIEYRKGDIFFSGVNFDENQGLLKSNMIAHRYENSNVDKGFVLRLLGDEISFLDTYHQICSYSSVGKRIFT